MSDSKKERIHARDRSDGPMTTADFKEMGIKCTNPSCGGKCNDEVVLACPTHRTAALLVTYAEGVISVRCRLCPDEKVIMPIAVAETRPYPACTSRTPLGVN